MLPHLPVEPSFVPRPTTALPDPIFRLDYTPAVSDLSLEDDQSDRAQLEPAPTRVSDAVNGVQGDVVKPDDWLWATMTRNRRATKEDWWQEVREIDLELVADDL
jgi:hypothetical protein